MNKVQTKRIKVSPALCSLKPFPPWNWLTSHKHRWDKAEWGCTLSCSSSSSTKGGQLISWREVSHKFILTGSSWLILERRQQNHNRHQTFPWWENWNAFIFLFCTKKIPTSRTCTMVSRDSAIKWSRVEVAEQKKVWGQRQRQACRAVQLIETHCVKIRAILAVKLGRQRACQQRGSMAATWRARAKPFDVERTGKRTDGRTLQAVSTKLRLTACRQCAKHRGDRWGRTPRLTHGTPWKPESWILGGVSSFFKNTSYIYIWYIYIKNIF